MPGVTSEHFQYSTNFHYTEQNYERQYIINFS